MLNAGIIRQGAKLCHVNFHNFNIYLTFKIQSGGRPPDLLVYKFVLFEPIQTIAGPRMRVGKRGLVSKSHSMMAVFVDVQVEWDMIFAEGNGEHEGVFRRNGFVAPGAPDKTGRRVGLDLQFTGKCLDQFTRRI